MRETMHLRPATGDDVAAVRDLLKQNNLGEAGFLDQFGDSFVVLEEDGTVVSVAGMEVHGDLGLLRSVAVSPALHGKGFGRKLVEDRLRWARNSGLRAVYLLTEGAAPFFSRLGFQVIERSDVPTRIQRTPEFAEFCPESATAMVLSLQKESD